jgi:hypothetical protein
VPVVEEVVEPIKPQQIIILVDLEVEEDHL